MFIFTDMFQTGVDLRSLIIVIMINLTYITQFDTNGILTALNIVIRYVQTHYMHLCIDLHEHSYSYTYRSLHIYTYTDTCTNTYMHTCMHTYVHTYIYTYSKLTPGLPADHSQG